MKEQQSATVKMCGQNKDTRFRILQSSRFVILWLRTPRIPNSVANPDLYRFRGESKLGGGYCATGSSTRGNFTLGDERATMC
jgi:hypothetical protein